MDMDHQLGISAFETFEAANFGHYGTRNACELNVVD